MIEKFAESGIIGGIHMSETTRKKSAVRRIGVLTSGGDAPGMNAAVRSVVRAAISMDIDVVGIRRGWNGLINGDIVRLDEKSVAHIINRGECPQRRYPC